LECSAGNLADTTGAISLESLGDAVSLYNLETQERINQLTQFCESRDGCEYGSKSGACVNQQYRPPRSLCDGLQRLFLYWYCLTLKRDCRHFLQTSQGNQWCCCPLSLAFFWEIGGNLICFAAIMKSFRCSQRSRESTSSLSPFPTQSAMLVMPFFSASSDAVCES